MRTLVIALATLTMATACASSRADSGRTQPSSPSPEQVTSAGQQGTLTGLVTISGGPMTTNGQMALNNTPQPNKQVIVTAAGREVGKSTTDSAGHFTASLPAGDYTVSDDCGGQPVTVVGGRTTSVTLSCDVP